MRFATRSCQAFDRFLPPPYSFLSKWLTSSDSNTLLFHEKTTKSYFKTLIAICALVLEKKSISKRMLQWGSVTKVSDWLKPDRRSLREGKCHFCCGSERMLELSFHTIFCSCFLHKFSFFISEANL